MYDKERKETIEFFQDFSDMGADCHVTSGFAARIVKLLKRLDKLEKQNKSNERTK